VRPIQAAPNTRWLSAATQVPIISGAKLALASASPSAQNFAVRATSPAHASARAERRPEAPAACSARRVSAAAMPLGKRSCSTLIICRFIGMAIVTPSTASRNTQASIVDSARGRASISMNAANAEISVPPVEYPAELAVDCMQLFSRMVIGVRASPLRCSAVQIA
jgi:hypothetical protein